MKEYFRGGYVVSAHVNEMCITNVKISQGFTCNQNGEKRGNIYCYVDFYLHTFYSLFSIFATVSI